MKYISAKLKKEPMVSVEVGDIFKRYDWLTGSEIIEKTKRQLLSKMKIGLHEQIAILDLDDLNFTIEE